VSDSSNHNLHDGAFRDIVDSLDAVWVMSSVRDDQGAIVDFRYEYVNPAGLRLLGEGRDEVLGHRLLELHPSTVELGIFDAYRAVVETGEANVSELPWFDERHVQGFFEVRVTRFGDGYLGWARDITERKRSTDDRTRLAAIMRTFPQALVALDVDLTIVSWNPGAEQVYGYPASEAVGQPIWMLAPREGGEEIRDLGTRVLHGEIIKSLQTQRRHRDGHLVDILLTLSPILDDDGRISGVSALAEDITQRVQTERRIVEDESLLRTVLDSTSDGTIRYDADLRVDYVNDRVLRLTDTKVEAWLGKTNPELGFPDDHIRRVFDTGEKVVHEFETDNLEGHRWYEAVVTPQFAKDGSISHVLAISRDITERELAKQELTVAATHDPLTGLANRPALLDEINRALESSRRSGRGTGLLMIDLDHFKNVNDSLGHATGDALLVEAARRLESTVRAGDLLARQGGDEFVVVMRDLDDQSEGMHVAERIVGGFRRPLLAADLELTTTASVGVTLSEPWLSIDADDLLREADTAMYVAKEDGRDRAALFNTELRNAVSERRLLAEELRHALPRNELAMWYQPEIDLSDGSIRAVEALLRWHHPSGQLYRAGRFIDIAEDSGLIVAIGNWSMGQICHAAIRWAEARPEHRLIVRVNLSAVQLAEAGLLEDIDRALATPDLDPKMLCVEVDERAMLQDTAAVRANLAGIRARGISVALDNFGTGYSALSSLHDYGVDAVMLDRSLVAHLATDVDARDLVTGIVALARRMEIAVSGTGVEHPDQAKILHELGCVGAQGFLYFDAVPPERVDRLLGIDAPPD